MTDFATEGELRGYAVFASGSADLVFACDSLCLKATVHFKSEAIEL